MNLESILGRFMKKKPEAENLVLLSALPFKELVSQQEELQLLLHRLRLEYLRSQGRQEVVEVHRHMYAAVQEPAEGGVAATHKAGSCNMNVSNETTTFP